MLATLIGFVLAISILVFIHELGHFLFAKWTGCRVEEFAVGFKPAIFQNMYRGTNYVLGSIPIGGYVKIWGENGSQEVEGDPDNPQAFYNRPRWAQAVVLFGGILFNIILAWLCFSFLLTRGLEVSQTQFPDYEMTDARVQIIEVLDGYPAADADLQMGDVIVSIESSRGELLETADDWESTRNFIGNNGSDGLTMLIEKVDGGVSEIEMTTVAEDGRNVIGAQLDSIGTIELPFGKALVHGAEMTADFTVAIVSFLLGFFADLFVGAADTSGVAGPVGIASFAGESFANGLNDFVWFIAVLSLNLAVFNLLPIPALDGGRLVFVAIESMIRRPINPVWFYRVNAAGFVFLLGLMLVVTVFDVIKLF